MVTVVICVGSSCYVRGSDKVADIFETLIEKEGLQDKVELMGAFCMENCSMGVSVRVDNQIYSGLSVEDAETFFYDEIVSRVNKAVLYEKKVVA
jgi:NADH:ubiquinone oxidoreductase subunit E